ncbi:MAG: hypothetical protein GYB55_20325 [Cytophagales bacterium]|uniref:hypothetical protein n=1 Tax=Cyclobacterium marinum TaxID=104 RepID=UPI0030DAB4BF|nr:hypothetical protein [Cytophagales bacterium]
MELLSRPIFSSIAALLLVVFVNSCSQDNIQGEVSLFDGGDLNNWSSADMSY